MLQNIWEENNMARCCENCIHWKLCDTYGIDTQWHDKDNVEEYCKNYLSNEIAPRLRAYENITRLCSKCKKGGE